MTIQERITRIRKALGPVGPQIIQHDGSGGNQRPMALVHREDLTVVLESYQRAMERADESDKQCRLAWERQSEKDRAYGDAIRERDNARDHESAIAESLNHASDLAMVLANVVAATHATTHPAHVAEPVDSCAVCLLLSRAREWAK